MSLWMRTIAPSPSNRYMFWGKHIILLIRLSLYLGIFLSSLTPNAADVELFKALAKATRDGLEPANGDPRLDSLIPIHLRDQRVVAHLLQKQVASRAAAPQTGKRANDGGGESAKMREMREKIRRLEQKATRPAPTQPSKGGKGKGGSGAKSSGGGGKKKSFIPVPEELRGLEPTVGGKRACYSFNMDGCHAGKNCPKGIHACMRCGGTDHGARSKLCPRKK